MNVAILHTITDADQWNQKVQEIMATIEQGQLPAGLQVQMFLPGVDGQKAVCLWEADSVDSLKSFLDGAIGTAARNDYIAVNAGAAMGLPGQTATA